MRRILVAVVVGLITPLVAMAQASENNVDLTAVIPDMIVLGNPEGDIEIHEFSDYFCPACQAMTPRMAQLIQSDGNIRFVLHYYPNHGQRSLDFSSIGIAAYNEDPTMFVELHTWMMAQRGRMTTAMVLDYAESLGYSRPALEAGAADDATNMQQFRVNVSVADQLGIRGTPSFTIENAVASGFPGNRAIEEYIAQIREDGSYAGS